MLNMRGEVYTRRIQSDRKAKFRTADSVDRNSTLEGSLTLGSDFLETIATSLGCAMPKQPFLQVLPVEIL